MSAPCSVTGYLQEISARLVLNNPNWLHSSYTTNIVPRDGYTLNHHRHALRVMTKENPGNTLKDFVRMVEAALLSLRLLPVFKLCWSLSTWWPQQGSFGLEPGRMWGLVLPAGRLENTSGQTTLRWTWTIAIGPMDIHCQV